MEHKIFYLMGKSAAGKDTVYEELLQDEELDLVPLIPYTTRPIREAEQDGVDYHFTDEEGYRKLAEAGKVIEMREYQTVLGPWKYYTVDDGTLDFAQADILAIGTLESYRKLSDYYGPGRVIPLYIEVEDGIRLGRALKRELKPGNHKYEEMCRRFLADQKAFSEEKLAEVGIERRFNNDDERETCIEEIRSLIRDIQEEGEEGLNVGISGYLRT